MKEEIYKICTQLNDGQISVTQAQEQLLLLFSVSKRYLLESILEDCKSSFSEYHYEIVESYLDDGC
jgi:hypothetical protein